MDSVKRVSGKKTQHHPSSTTHQVLQKSKTLSRKFVKRPVAKAQITKREQLEREAMLRRKAIAEQMNRERAAVIARKQVGAVRVVAARREEANVGPQVHPKVAVTNARVAARKADAPRQLSAQELKERAISQALKRVATMGDAGGEQMTDAMTKKRGIWRKRKLFVALGMSVVSIALLGYLVHLNLPDLSVRVAAMQSGIEISDSIHVPAGYRMDGLVAEGEGKVTISFVHKDGNKAFTLVQEKSSWDSAALVSQFVMPEWDGEYELMKEQGLVVYVSGSDAAWVNGGIFFHIDDEGRNLSKQQLHDIVVSL